MPSNHALPTPPGQQQSYEQQPRPRAKSSFSFHSHKSSGSGQKIDLHETHEEKQSRRLHSKADPSMAIQEMEPAAVASVVKSSLAPLRAIQHRDNQGNPIADPDRSNPTRSRWERPLDTIRSFEAAIDGNYSRKSYMRSESGDPQTRRSSYFGGTQVTTDERVRHPQNSYYGGRPQSYRPDSYAQRPDSYYTSPENAGPGNGYYPNRARYPRTASEPHFNNPGVYPMPGNQQSYETMNTASGSGSSGDPTGYSTDPSSENSSVDRVAPLPLAKEPGETYGFSGFGGIPQYAPPGIGLQEQYIANPTNGAQRQGNGYQNQGPTVPRKESASRVPIKLGASSGNAGPPSDNQRPSAGEKRKSWFGKRFSRS